MKQEEGWTSPLVLVGLITSILTIKIVMTCDESESDIGFTLKRVLFNFESCSFFINFYNFI
jgi:hypothetical protein